MKEDGRGGNEINDETEPVPVVQVPRDSAVLYGAGMDEEDLLI